MFTVRYIRITTCCLVALSNSIFALTVVSGIENLKNVAKQRLNEAYQLNADDKEKIKAAIEANNEDINQINSATNSVIKDFRNVDKILKEKLRQKPSTTATAQSQPLKSVIEQNLVETYLNKIYTPEELAKYRNQTAKNVGVIGLFLDQGPASNFSNAIIERIALALQNFKQGPPTAEHIKEILLYAYYDVKEYMNELREYKKDKSDFALAERTAKEELKSFLTFGITSAKAMAHYIDQFEKDVDNGNIK